MSHIYVTSNGAKIGVEGGRIVITQRDGVTRSIPKETVESISIFGNSHMTTPCVHFVLMSGISVNYFSSKGRFFGRLESTNNVKNSVIRQQIRMLDDDAYRLAMSRKIISAKIRNQEVVLRRYLKERTLETERKLALMKSYTGKVESSVHLDEMRGFEGIAARTYFEIISGFIRSDFKFEGRNRRPPKDPFNSLLSLGYTLLFYEIYAKIESAGMTPFYGFLHEAYTNNPALASDLMEEWRSVIVDSVVLGMIQGNELDLDDFSCEYADSGVLLTKKALNKFVNKFERKMNTTIKYLIYDDSEYTMRNALNEQCRRLKNSFFNEDESLYAPVIIR